MGSSTVRMMNDTKYAAVREHGRTVGLDLGDVTLGVRELSLDLSPAEALTLASYLLEAGIAVAGLD